MALRAAVIAAAARDAVAETCESVTVASLGADAPHKCLDAGCAWFILDGRCVEVSDPVVEAYPTCCVGVEGTGCKIATMDEATDGTCAVNTAINGVTVTAPRLDEITRSLHLAGAAYCPQENVEAWSCVTHCQQASGISIHSTFHETATFPENFHGYVGYDATRDQFVVAIKGTDSSNINNWISNLDYFKTYPLSQYPDAGLHEGFWKGWVAIKDKVVAGLDELEAQYGSRDVHFIGHSLGGVVATNGALDLALNKGLTVGLTTFGSPRGGDYTYARAASEHLSYIWRVTHNDDIVAHVPPERMGFYHVPWEIHFPERTGLEYRLCDGTDEDNSCANACSFYLTCTSLDDHMNYLDKPATCGDGLFFDSIVVV